MQSHFSSTQELARLIEERLRIGETFTSQQLYEYERHFCDLYPRNHNIRAKLRQVVQRLRDKHNIVEFLDNRGTYVRIDRSVWIVKAPEREVIVLREVSRIARRSREGRKVVKKHRIEN